MSEKHPSTEFAEAAVWIALILCATFLIHSCASNDWINKSTPTQTQTQEQ